MLEINRTSGIVRRSSSVFVQIDLFLLGDRNSLQHGAQYLSSAFHLSTIMVLTRLKSRLGVNRLAVSPAIYRLSWWLILAVHMVSGVLVLVTAFVYLFFSRDAAFSSVSVLQIPQSTLRLSGWSYLVLAGVHAYAIFGLILRSTRAGQLTLRLATQPTLRDKKHQVFPMGERVNSSHWLDPRTWQAGIKRKYNSSFGLDGCLGINGVYFYRWYAVREAVEVGLQTYQANMLSRSVARTSINTLATAAIIFNCISSPIVFYVFRKREMVRRLVSLLVDMVLDITSAIVLPLAVVYPYLAAYDPSTRTMPPQLYLDDAWLISALEVIRQSAVTSLVDYFASLLPHVSVISCLSIAKKMIRRDDRLRRRLSMQIVTAPTTDLSEGVVPVSGGELGKSHHAIHTIMSLAWAGFVLTTHLTSQLHMLEPNVGHYCRLPMNPWFASKDACAVVQLNCYREGIEGRSDEIAARLSPFDRLMVKKIIITHCPALEVPPVLQEFRELTAIAVYNVTFRSWTRDAAITSTANPRLSTIEILEARVDSPLDGIYHRDMPASFSFFTVAKSNLSGLPDDVGILWKRLKFQVFNAQFTNLSRLPSSFSRLSIQRLRLISNDLESVDELTYQHQSLVTLHLSGNPLSSLPTSIGDVSKLTELLVEDTLVRTVPDQITAWLQSKPSKVSFSGSPVCSSSSLPTNVAAQLCDSRVGNALGTLGWDLIVAQRPL